MNLRFKCIIHHVVSVTALIHRTDRSSIFAMSRLLGLSPKCVQLNIMVEIACGCAAHTAMIQTRTCPLSYWQRRSTKPGRIAATHTWPLTAEWYHRRSIHAHTRQMWSAHGWWRPNHHTRSCWRRPYNAINIPHYIVNVVCLRYCCYYLGWVHFAAAVFARGGIITFTFVSCTDGWCLRWCAVIFLFFFYFFLLLLLLLFFFYYYYFFFFSNFSSRCFYS